MSSGFEERAQAVVTRFRDLLGPEGVAVVGEARLGELEQLIVVAMSEELEGYVEQVEELGRRLRGAVEKREMGL